MQKATSVALAVVGLAAAGIAALVASSADSDDDGARAPAYGAPPPMGGLQNEPLPDMQPDPPGRTEPSAIATDWPVKSNGERLSSAEQIAFLQAALRLTGADFPASPDLTPPMLDAWDRLLRERAAPRLGELPGNLKQRVGDMIFAISQARRTNELVWYFDDFSLLMRFVPEALRARVDDDAEVILGRSIQ